MPLIKEYESGITSYKLTETNEYHNPHGPVFKAVDHITYMLNGKYQNIVGPVFQSIKSNNKEYYINDKDIKCY